MDSSTNGDDDYLDNHDQANVITTSIGGGLSMIGVMFIVISYFKLVEYRAGGTTAQTILLYISIADFVAAVSNVVSVWLPKPMDTKPTSACKAGGFMIIFAATASFFWTSCLTIYLYLIVINKNHLISQRKKMLMPHALCWGLPLFFACLALGCKALGPAPILKHKNETRTRLTTGGWCWIKEFENKADTIAWTMMTSKLWELTSYLLILVLFIAIFVQLHWKATATIDEDTMMEAKKVEKRMMFIPVAFILLRIWGTVRYFAYASSLSVRTKVLMNIPLYALQGLGDSSQGFANSIFFFLSNKRVYQYWKYTLSNFLPDFLCYNPDYDTSERTPLLQSLDIQK